MKILNGIACNILNWNLIKKFNSTIVLKGIENFLMNMVLEKEKLWMT
jgi:hypothetical protein